MLWKQFVEQPWDGENIFVSKTNLFKTNYSKPFREPTLICSIEPIQSVATRLYNFEQFDKFRSRSCKMVISLFVDVALRAALILNTISLFVDVALRAASILKNRDFSFC